MASKVTEGRKRVIIGGVSPEVDGGRFPIKRVVDEAMTTEADIFADGHDALWAALLFRRQADPQWTEVPMESPPNDRWRGTFPVTEIWRYRYTLMGWVDRFKSWPQDLAKKVEAEQNVSVDVMTGPLLITERDFDYYV